MIPALISSRSRRSLYVSPHQDDEQLTYGSSILADVAAGFEVTVLLVTDGRNAWARTSETLTTRLGYTPTHEQFSAARDREFIDSVQRMGATPIVPAYGTREVDGSGTEAGIIDLIETYATPGAHLRGTSPYDYHVDHRAVGDALVTLAGQGFGDDLWLGLSANSINIPENNTVPEETDLEIKAGYVPLYYQHPYRTVALPDWWAVGVTDVPTMFAHITDTDPRTYWHR